MDTLLFELFASIGLLWLFWLSVGAWERQSKVSFLRMEQEKDSSWSVWHIRTDWNGEARHCVFSHGTYDKAVDAASVVCLKEDLVVL